MNPLVLIGVGLGLLLFVLLLALVVKRRRGKQKQSGLEKAPQPTLPVETASAQQAPSLTDIIGQAKVPKAAGSGKTAGSRASESQTKSDATPEPSPRSDGAPTTPKRLVQPGHHDNKIQILVVDDNRDTCENVSRLIAFESDMEVVGQAFNGIMGVELAQEYQPHIVLMDINMPDMDGITATREMVVKVPYCQVVIMSVQFETDYMRSAMLAGARDYQTKPFTADELVNCLRRVYVSAKNHYLKYDEPRFAAPATATSEVAVIERKTTGLNAPVYMAYGPKGGTGTSVIGLNVAAALNLEQPGVTLFEADLQFGDLPVHLNLRPTKSLADLLSSNRPDAELLPDLLLSHSSGVSVLFAPPKPEAAELITASMVVQTVRRLRDRSAAIIIDSASYLTDQTLALFDVSSLVLLVITPELTAIKNARIFCDMAPLLGMQLQNVVLVINRFNMPGAIPAAQVEKALGLARTFTVPDDPKLRYAAAKGATIFQLDANAPSAQAIAALAKVLRELTAAPSATGDVAPPAPPKKT